MMRASSGARKERASGFVPLHDVVGRLWMWERQEGRRSTRRPSTFSGALSIREQRALSPGPSLAFFYERATVCLVKGGGAQRTTNSDTPSAWNAAGG